MFLPFVKRKTYAEFRKNVLKTNGSVKIGGTIFLRLLGVKAA